MLINSVFLFQWYFWPRFLPRAYSQTQKLCCMIGISLLAWFLLSSITVMVQEFIRESGGNRTLKMQYLGLFCAALQLLGGLKFCLQPINPQRGTKKVPLVMLLSRGLMAGISVTSSVLISSVNGVLAGLATTFPSIFMTIMVSVWLSQGSGVSTGAIGPMILGGLAPGVYSMTFGYATPRTGISLAICIAWFVSVTFVSLPCTLFLQKRIKTTLEQIAKLEAANARVNTAPPCDQTAQGKRENMLQPMRESWGEEVDSAAVLVIPGSEELIQPSTGTSTPIPPHSVNSDALLASSPLQPKEAGASHTFSRTIRVLPDDMPWGEEVLPTEYDCTDPISFQNGESTINIRPLTEEEYYGDCEDGHGVFGPKNTSQSQAVLAV